MRPQRCISNSNDEEIFGYIVVDKKRKRKIKKTEKCALPNTMVDAHLFLLCFPCLTSFPRNFDFATKLFDCRDYG